MIKMRYSFYQLFEEERQKQHQEILPTIIVITIRRRLTYRRLNIDGDDLPQVLENHLLDGFIEFQREGRGDQLGNQIRTLFGFLPHLMSLCSVHSHPRFA